MRRKFGKMRGHGGRPAKPMHKMRGPARGPKHKPPLPRPGMRPRGGCLGVLALLIVVIGTVTIL